MFQLSKGFITIFIVTVISTLTCSQLSSACFGYSIICEGIGYTDYDGGSQDVEFHSITVPGWYLGPGGSHEFDIKFDYWQSCGDIYSGMFFVLENRLDSGLTYSLTNDGGDNINGVSQTWMDTGTYHAYLTVTNTAASMSSRADLTVRLWCNDTDACNEHNTIDTITTCEVSTSTGYIPVPLFVQVTAPKPGDRLFCPDYDVEIRWNAYGGTAPITLDIELSSTGPTGPWTTIATGVANTAIYKWMTIARSSTNCYIRITATDSAVPPNTISDMNDMPFEMLYMGGSTMLELIRPNGGETLMGGSTIDILWNAAGSSYPLFVTLEYSTSALGPWYMIVNKTIKEGTYAWKVPSVSSSDCYLKATLFDDAVVLTDMSDSSFSIIGSATKPTVTVTSPTGGEIWAAGTVHDVTWSATGGMPPLTISISLSTTGVAGPWSTITSSQVNDGSFAWTVPHVSSTDCYVKVVAEDSLLPPQNGTGKSASAFTIDNSSKTPPPSIIVTSPNGGEIWYANSSHDIKWTSAGGNGTKNVVIEYSTNGTIGPWISLAIGEPDDGTYSWKIPPNASKNCLVRTTINDSSVPPVSANDTSNLPFEISVSSIPLPSITVLSPDGGEVLDAGKSHEIRWIALNGTPPLSIKLEYSINGAAGPWNLISSNEPNDGKYAWTIPATPSANCIVKASVSDSCSPPQSAYDDSNATFTINYTIVPPPPAPTIKVISPNGGEIWIPSSVHNISWTSAGGTPPTYVKLEYSTTGISGPWIIIASGQANTGNYSWTTPMLNSSVCLMRLTVVDSASPVRVANDTSDSVFSINATTPPTPQIKIAVLSPNGGETIAGGSVAQVKWASNGGKLPRTIKLEYSRTGTSGPWIQIVAGEPDDGTYSWSMVPDIASSECLLRATVTDSSAPVKSAQDTSNDTFTIMSMKNGTVRGTVTNISGATLSGAIVRVMKVGMLITSVTTNSAGAYSINLAPGEYTVNSSAASHYNSANVALTIATGEEVVQNFELIPLKSGSGGGNGGGGGGASNTGTILGLPAMMFYMIVIVIIVVICIAVGGIAAASGRKKKESQGSKWVQYQSNPQSQKSQNGHKPPSHGAPPQHNLQQGRPPVYPPYRGR